ncbi:hypothetical protein C8J57DRAFT_1485607 [Mycena rebaudengoi]|nr:hypothetical protein C8J57DRAFT_1485607 [Mycena rebaudengoi]
MRGLLSHALCRYHNLPNHYSPDPTSLRGPRVTQASSKGAAEYSRRSAQGVRKGRSGSGSGVEGTAPPRQRGCRPRKKSGPSGGLSKWCWRSDVVRELATGEAVRRASAAEHPRRDARGVRDISEWWWCREAGRCLAKEGVVQELEKSGGTRLQERSMSQSLAARMVHSRLGGLRKRVQGRQSNVCAESIRSAASEWSKGGEGGPEIGKIVRPQGIGKTVRPQTISRGDRRVGRRSGEGGGKRGDGFCRTRKVSCAVFRAPEKAQYVREHIPAVLLEDQVIRRVVKARNSERKGQNGVLFRQRVTTRGQRSRYAFKRWRKRREVEECYTDAVRERNRRERQRIMLRAEGRA